MKHKPSMFIAFLSLIGVTVSSAVFISARAYATNTTFTQNIAPIDCSFDAVSNGTGVSYSITPSTCSTIAEQPGIPLPTAVRMQVLGTPAQNQQAGSPKIKGLNLAWQPIATVNQTSKKNNAGSIWRSIQSIVIGVASLLGIIAIFVFIL